MITRMTSKTTSPDTTPATNANEVLVFWCIVERRLIPLFVPVGCCDDVIITEPTSSVVVALKNRDATTAGGLVLAVGVSVGGKV